MENGEFNRVGFGDNRLAENFQGQILVGPILEIPRLA